jgi:hypothetical protein
MRSLKRSPDAIAADREAWGTAERAPKLKQQKDPVDNWTPVGDASLAQFVRRRS